MIATAYFASGCFWSKEYTFRKVPGVVDTRVGFLGGHTAHPTYRQVCTKTTGHAETVEVQFDPEVISFEELCRFFFEIHDPTIDRTANGGQYRSAIFYRDAQQRNTAASLIKQLEAHGYAVVTELAPAGDFWPAEERHQGYCEMHGMEPSLKRVLRFSSGADLPA